jgi:hypothetical protein
MTGQAVRANKFRRTLSKSGPISTNQVKYGDEGDEPVCDALGTRRRADRPSIAA